MAALTEATDNVVDAPAPPLSDKKRASDASAPAAKRPSLGPSSAIAKSSGRASSNRRMSLVARQSEAGGALMAKREAAMHAANSRRSTMDPRG